MNIKTSKLSGAALDYAIAIVEGRTIKYDPMGFKKDAPESKQAGYWIWEDHGVNNQKTCYWLIGSGYSPSTIWEQGGPIIEREKISLIRCSDDYTSIDEFIIKHVPVWFAEHGGGHSPQDSYGSQGDSYGYEFCIDIDSGSYAAFPLIAAMRCYVTSKLGDTIDIPEQLA